jgi:hypothetical protein
MLTMGSSTEVCVISDRHSNAFYRSDGDPHISLYVLRGSPYRNAIEIVHVCFYNIAVG